MMTQCVLPAELILRVLYYTNPRDIITQWRRVSKRFHAITSDLALWKTLYRCTPFPLPPGPLPQSIPSLERTLVKAARLAQSWPASPMSALSTFTIENGESHTPPILISGRWLVVCESAQRFVLHDADAHLTTADTPPPQVLWDFKKPVVLQWDAESVISAEGHCLVYVLSDQLPWKLLEFRLNHHTGRLCDSAAIEPPKASRRLSLVRLLAGSVTSPFLFICAEPNGLVLDTRTRIFYKVPASTDYSGDPSCMALTDTYLIRLDNLVPQRTCIKVFTLPSDTAPRENDSPVLLLTHEVTVHANIRSIKVIRSRMDSVTGITHIRLLSYSKYLELSFVNLTLLRHSITEVSPAPITVELRNIPIPTAPLPPMGFSQYADVSHDGHVRGFFLCDSLRTIMHPKLIHHVMKFTIDDTRPDPSQWTITCGQIARPKWSGKDPPFMDLTGPELSIVFDGMRGRLCYGHEIEMGKIVVLDVV